MAGGGGSYHLFLDVASIDEHLGEPARTVELFRLLDANQPGLAADCYPLAEEAIVGAGEWQLGSRYIPAPVARIERMRRRREELIPIHAEIDAPDDSVVRRAPELFFAREVGHMVKILDGAGRAEEAARVRELALATSDCREVREALGLPPASP